MGPTVAVLLSSEADAPAPEELLQLARTLDESARSSTELSIHSTAPIGGSVNLEDGRPFGFNVGAVNLEGEELNAIRQAFGFAPASALHVFAYANTPVDHRILAELGIFFARRYKGIVDFGGNLGSVDARYGKVVEIRYAVDGTPAAFHVSDAAFLEEWLASGSFHMIK